MTAHYYFAYGSNMNRERVGQRGMGFEGLEPGTLANYSLIFNKRSVKQPGTASANVMEDYGSVTEGVVYKLKHPSEIEMMDPYESYPICYNRMVMPISTREVMVDAWVYVANEAYVETGLKPAGWYLNHLLQGEPFLSKAYLSKLRKTECLDQFEVEPTTTARAPL